MGDFYSYEGFGMKHFSDFDSKSLVGSSDLVKCSRCGSPRIVEFSGRCKDMCTIQFHGATLNNGTDTYEGYPVILGKGDNLEVSICIECGQVQGFDWPLDPEYYDFLTTPESE